MNPGMPPEFGRSFDFDRLEEAEKLFRYGSPMRD